MSKFEISEKAAEEFLTGSSSSLKGLLEPIIQKIIETKFEEYIGSKPYERLPEETRKCYRNGTRVLRLKSSCGVLNVEIPQTRTGHFDTEFVSKLKLHEQALLLSIVEMSKLGISNRNVRDITKVLCDLEISKSDVSRLSFHIKESVDKFFARKLVLEYPVIFIDAIYMSLRVSECSRSVAVFVMIGINENGMREVVNLDVFENEGEYNWKDFFQATKRRGLHGVKWVVSDAHEGIKSSVKKEFIGSTWQRCQYHFTKNVLSRVPSKFKFEFTEKLQSIFLARDKAEALKIALELGDEYAQKIPKAIEILDAGIEDAINFLALSKKYRNKLNTSNIVERCNREIRRRTKAIGTFGTEQSIKNYVGSVLIKINERWEKRKYVDMADFYLNIQEQAKTINNKLKMNKNALKIAK